MNNTASHRRGNTLWRIFAMPLFIGITSLVGLIVTLLGNDIWHLVGWITLALPVVIVAWAMQKKARSTRARH